MFFFETEPKLCYTPNLNQTGIIWFDRFDKKRNLEKKT